MEEALKDWCFFFFSLVGGSDKEFLECLDNQECVCACVHVYLDTVTYCLVEFKIVFQCQNVIPIQP